VRRNTSSTGQLPVARPSTAAGSQTLLVEGRSHSHRVVHLGSRKMEFEGCPAARCASSLASAATISLAATAASAGHRKGDKGTKGHRRCNLFMATFGALLYFLSIYFQDVLRYSALEIGLAFLIPTAVVGDFVGARGSSRHRGGLAIHDDCRAWRRRRRCAGDRVRYFSQRVIPCACAGANRDQCWRWRHFHNHVHCRGHRRARSATRRRLGNRLYRLENWRGDKISRSS
jgi:hypothetical protein